jgi:hypothetical protein
MATSTNTVIISSMMRCTKHVAHVEEKENGYRISVGKAERKRLHGRPRRRWEGNIKMALKVMGLEGITWIRLWIGKRYGYCEAPQWTLGLHKM